MVLASFLQYQVLDTSLVFGATIQATFDARHMSVPPSTEVPNETRVTKADKNFLQVPESLMQPIFVFLQVPD